MISKRTFYSDWIDRTFAIDNPSIRLFCFPYAGGSSQTYYTWADKFSDTIELCPIQLPGRGSRFQSPPYRQVDRLIEALAENILPALDRPCAFFGHSMGGIIAYELAHYLGERNEFLPAHLFVSGCRAPTNSANNEKNRIFDLPESEFVEELRKLNGIPQKVLNNRALMDILTPLLRADIELVETHKSNSNSPLQCPITAFGGLSDPNLDRDDIKTWDECTSAYFSYHILPGDHFFIKNSEPILLQIVLQHLFDHLTTEVN
jgi:medium-chain acyl-[acyl-carrier-protein] hydrolase